MELQDIADGVVEHVETGGLINLVCRLANVHKVEYWGKNFVHSLHVLNFGVELGVDVEDSSHVVVAICFTLLLLVSQELLVGYLVLAVYHLEFLSTSAREERNHYLSTLLCEE